MPVRRHEGAVAAGLRPIMLPGSGVSVAMMKGRVGVGGGVAAAARR